MNSPGAGATNAAVRAAVEAFAAHPSHATSIDVLRHCLHGELLFDGTGSKIEYLDGDPETIGPGSTIAIATGAGPDGRSAVLAFTSHQEIERVHAADDEVVSFVQAAADVLEFAQANGHGWIFLDPAGPTCVLSIEEIEFALHIPRNDAVRNAMEPDVPRAQLVAALRAEGNLVLGIEADDAPPEGVLQEKADVSVRTTSAPEGGVALIAYTCGPEALARDLTDRIVVRTSAEILAMVRSDGFAGLVLNPAGPWAFVRAAELIQSVE